MTARRTDELIDDLIADAAPVKPLASPGWRALATLALLVLLGALAIFLLPDNDPLAARGEDGRMQAGLELFAMTTTGVVAVIAAFHLSVPGRSRRWLVAPFPPFIAWLALSGAGCWRDLVGGAPGEWTPAHGADCLIFILGASLLLGAPLAWRLSRAAPIDPLPVAGLGGLGSAALSAGLLQFFHPFAVTFLDLAVHVFAVLTVMATAALLSRRILRPA